MRWRASVRWAVAIAFLVRVAAAQDNAPAGFLRGELLNWAGTSRTGQFTFRVAPDRVYSCSYDDMSYMELDHRRIATLKSAEPGDRMELLSDRRFGSSACYARIVRVLYFERVNIVAGVRPRLKPVNAAPVVFQRHPDLSLSGVVIQTAPDSLLLRSRSGEHSLIRLRPDTHYMAEGHIAEPVSLRPNTIVFIRAARTVDGEIEAYQVVWGDILQPQP